MDGKQIDLVSSKWGTQADQPSYRYCTSLHLQCTQINNNVLKYLSSYIFPTFIKLKFLFKTSVNKVSHYQHHGIQINLSTRKTAVYFFLSS